MFKTSIESVIADISAKVGKLRDLAEKHHALAIEHSDEASKHEKAAIEQADNRDKAVRIADKFDELIK